MSSTSNLYEFSNSARRSSIFTNKSRAVREGPEVVGDKRKRERERQVGSRKFINIVVQDSN